MEKHSRVMGVLKEIEQRYVYGKLVETYLTIRADGRNGFFHFLGLVPDSLLGKPVDFEEHVTKEDEEYYYVQQAIMGLEPVHYHPSNSRALWSAKEELECRYLIKVEGKIAK